MSKQIQDAYIVAAARTPIGKAPKGAFRNVRSDDLLVRALQAALAQVPSLDPKTIEDAIVGCSFPEAEQGANMARLAVLLAGLPNTVGGVTVNRFCASGLTALAMAADRIRVGEAEVMIAAGAESMSMIPMSGNTPSFNPRAFERDENLFGRAFIQTLEPRAFYARTPYKNQDTLPVYDSGATDFNLSTIYSENTYVGHDRLVDNDALTLGVGSRFFDADNGAEMLRVGVAQRIRFSDQQVVLPGQTASTTGLSDILFGAGVRWDDRWSLDATVQANNQTHEETSNYPCWQRRRIHHHLQQTKAKSYWTQSRWEKGNEINCQKQLVKAAEWRVRSSFGFLPNPALSNHKNAR
jgi:hypothetical protein